MLYDVILCCLYKAIDRTTKKDSHMKKYSVILSIFLVFALNSFAFANVAGEKFMQALEKSDVQGIKRGFAVGFDVDIDLGSIVQREDGFEGVTPLMWAASTGNLAVAKFLIQNGANIDLMNDPDDMTPLMYAVANGHKEMLEFLLTQKADVNRMSYRGWTALKSAVYHNHGEIVQLLIDGGANVNAYLPPTDVIDTSYASALMNAVWDNRLEAVKILMDNNANMHFKDREKETALMHAERMGHTEIAEYLKNYINPKLYDNEYFSKLFQGDVHIEKRVTGAFSKPHAHEELIVFSLKNSADNQGKNKIVAIFDVQSAELLAQKQINTPYLSIDLLTTRQNSNIVLANYFEEVQGKQIHYVEAFQLQNKAFVSSNILDSVHKKLKKDMYLFSVSENDFLQGDFLDVFRVGYDENMQKNIHLIKTFKWQSLKNSFEEVSGFAERVYRGHIGALVPEQNWIPQFLEVLDSAIKSEDGNLEAWLKTIPAHLLMDKLTKENGSDTQRYKLIAKTDKEVIIGRYIYFVDKIEAEKQQEVDPYSYATPVAYTMQCFIFDAENGHKVSWVGLPPTIEIAKKENSKNNKPPLKFSANDLKKIGVFLSNFTEIGLDSFSAEDVLDGNNPNTMLYFATNHNFINNYKSRIKRCEKDCPFGQFSIDAKYVKESLKKYFNYTLMNPPSTPTFYFENNRYYFNAEKKNPVLYARADHAEETADGNVKVTGVIYNSKNKKELHGNFEALIKAHEWNDKLTWTVLELQFID